MKHSDAIALLLKERKFTHFFFVGGGNIMHLIGSLSKFLQPIPVIHEVAAIIGSEYFNKASIKQRSLALVTAGPGITNAITGIAGAYLESRAVLIIGGQVKKGDLKTGNMRQRGIQEIDGVSLCEPVTKKSIRMEETWTLSKLNALFELPFQDRKGPVFLEVPLDVQAIETKVKKEHILDFNSKFYKQEIKNSATLTNEISRKNSNLIKIISEAFQLSKRPVLLIGGGVNKNDASIIHHYCKNLKIPICTTWNGIDLIDSRSEVFAGRPNTWGQRSSNIIIQQSDFILAIGARLGLQQTGFDWKNFGPLAKIAMIDVDKSELTKTHPKIDFSICCDSNLFIKKFTKMTTGDWSTWLNYAQFVRRKIPLNERHNNYSPPKGYVQPYDFVDWLSEIIDYESILIPCSSGSAFTCVMQNFQQKFGQKIISNKGLASMGYGLSGAIGAAIANPNRRTFLVEGDGGFAQNMQELGTVIANNLNLKMFIFDDMGHASIRMTQKNYFNGDYVGCDISTGLGLPNFSKLGKIWDFPSVTITSLKELKSKKVKTMLSEKGPVLMVLKIHPHQTYFPKIQSRVVLNGDMKSNPLHKMSPSLSDDINKQVFKYLPPEFL